MRLLDVHREKSSHLTISFIHRLKTLDRASERRSREATEHKHYRPAAEMPGELRCGRPIESEEFDIRRAVADPKRALLSLIVANHSDDVAGSDLRHDDRGCDDRDGEERNEHDLDHVNLDTAACAENANSLSVKFGQWTIRIKSIDDDCGFA